MAFSAYKESKYWQAFGAAFLIAGFLIMLLAYYYRSVASTPLAGRESAYAACFIMIFGASCFCFGRVLNAVANGFYPLELRLFRLMSGVTLLVGAPMVVLSVTQVANRTLPVGTLSAGVGGSMLLMIATTTFITQRAILYVGKRDPEMSGNLGLPADDMKSEQLDPEP